MFYKIQNRFTPVLFILVYLAGFGYFPLAHTHGFGEDDSVLSIYLTSGRQAHNANSSHCLICVRINSTQVSFHAIFNFTSSEKSETLSSTDRADDHFIFRISTILDRAPPAFSFPV